MCEKRIGGRVNACVDARSHRKGERKGVKVTEAFEEYKEVKATEVFEERKEI